MRSQTYLSRSGAMRSQGVVRIESPYATCHDAHGPPELEKGSRAIITAIPPEREPRLQAFTRGSTHGQTQLVLYFGLEILFQTAN